MPTNKRVSRYGITNSNRDPRARCELAKFVGIDVANHFDIGHDGLNPPRWFYSRRSCGRLHLTSLDAGDALPTITVYVLLYAALVVGTFSVVTLLAGKGTARHRSTHLEDLLKTTGTCIRHGVSRYCSTSLLAHYGEHVARRPDNERANHYQHPEVPVLYLPTSIFSMDIVLTE